MATTAEIAAQRLAERKTADEYLEWRKWATRADNFGYALAQLHDGFVSKHGSDPRKWPKAVRDEFRRQDEAVYASLISSNDEGEDPAFRDLANFAANRDADRGDVMGFSENVWEAAHEFGDDPGYVTPYDRSIGRESWSPTPPPAPQALSKPGSVASQVAERGAPAPRLHDRDRRRIAQQILTERAGNALIAPLFENIGRVPSVHDWPKPPRPGPAVDLPEEGGTRTR